ncbi:hypothetical protein H8356DRAFT_1753641, partial [Neocallimastix lanati (nom. inval.)]
TDFNSFHSAMPTSFRLVLSNVSIEELLLCLISIVLPFLVMLILTEHKLIFLLLNIHLLNFEYIIYYNILVYI